MSTKQSYLWICNSTLNACKNILFQISELHIAFAILKVMRKYIEENGLDKPPVEAGISSETTLQQIISCKHVKRRVKVNTTLYLALFHIYFSDWYNQNPENREAVEHLRRTLEDLQITGYMKENTDQLKGHS